MLFWKINTMFTFITYICRTKVNRLLKKKINVRWIQYERWRRKKSEAFIEKHDYHILRITYCVLFLLTSITRHSERYLFCCLTSELGTVTECLPEPDQFSSCKDLIRIPLLKIFMWILGLSALIGNSYVVITRLMPTRGGVKKRAMAQVQDTMVSNLAVADCIMGFYMIIIASADVHYRDIYAHYAQSWQTSVICKLAGFLSILSCESSVFFMTLISVDRYVGVVFPTSKFKLRPTTVMIAAGGIWGFTLFMSIFPVMARGLFGDAFYGRSTVCLALPLTRERPPGWQYSVMIFLGFNLVAFTAMMYCYISIYLTAKKAGAQVGRNSESRKKEIKLAVRMGFLVFTDLCCWMPVIVMGMLSLSGVVDIPSISYAWIAVFVLPLNSALNPYLYTIAMRERKNKVGPASGKTVEASQISKVQDGTEIADEKGIHNP